MFLRKDLGSQATVRRYSLKYVFIKWPNIHKKTPVLESLYNKFAGLKAFDFIKRKLQHRCFSVDTARFLRASFPQNTSERLLL